MNGNEEVCDVVVLKNQPRNPLRFLCCHSGRPARLGVELQEIEDAGVELALGNSGFPVMAPVAVDGLIHQGRGHLRKIQQRVAELGSDHRIQHGLVRNR